MAPVLYCSCPLQGMPSCFMIFDNSPAARSVLERWMFLALKYQNEFRNDQPFFSMAMEQLGFNPYTLSLSYNYRGFGDSISGIVRVWHSRASIPEEINEFEASASSLRRLSFPAGPTATAPDWRKRSAAR